MKHLNKLNVIISNKLFTAKTNMFIKYSTKLYDSRSYSGLFSQYEKCPYCKGKKILQCLDCDGYGKEYLGAMKETLCTTCTGSGYLVCSFCGGSGINHML